MTGTTPNGIRYPDGATKAKNLGPELKQFALDVDRFIDDEIAAESETFLRVAREAAARAVTDDLAARDVVVGGDRRILDDTDPASHHVRDETGASAFGVDKDGNASFRNKVAMPGAVIEPSEGFSLRDAHDKYAFRLDPATGKFYIYDPVLVGYEGGGGHAARRVVVNILAGQSNMEGRGRPWSAELDPQDSRHYMYDWATGQIITATVPLSSQQQQVGLSPGTVIANETLANEPAGTVVVSVNVAAGGSGLVNRPAQGNWAWGYTGSVPNLANIMVATVDAALARIAQMFPGVALDLRFFWVQGEADSDGDAYRMAFDVLAVNSRGHFGRPDMPVIVGGIVPEYGTANPTKLPIIAAHVDTPRRLMRSAYAPGISNGGGSANVGDLVHYSREAVIRLGKAMYAALQRARTNVSTSVPVPPLDVSATRVDGAVTVKWSQPMCRVTGYVLEHSADGSTWTTAPTSFAPLATSLTIASAGPLWVRLTTSNESGTSATTAPIRSIGA